MLQLDWINGEENERCLLPDLNLTHKHFDGLEGVYVIWHGGWQPRIIGVGQGVIRDRLGEHRQDKKITRYSEHGLLVTWASVDRSVRDGVEAFLAKNLIPLVGERFPDAVPREVNIPLKIPRTPREKL
jgi:hypothetical protein